MKNLLVLVIPISLGVWLAWEHSAWGVIGAGLMIVADLGLMFLPEDDEETPGPPGVTSRAGQVSVRRKDGPGIARIDRR